MSEPTRDDVLETMKRVIPPDDRAAVLGILDEYGPDMPEQERVHLAILKVSGSIWQLRDATDQAKRNYHGVLAFADRRPSRDDVIAAVNRDFPNEDRADVLTILDQYGYRGWAYERERVQLAILRLSDGNLDGVRAALRVANTDYRDLLLSRKSSSPHRTAVCGTTDA